MNRFKDQTAVITGGGNGIGFAIAEKLAGEGAKILILDRDVALSEKAAGTLRDNGYKCDFIAVDISNEAEVKFAFNKIQDAGGCTIVVNSAGIVGPNGIKTEDVELPDFEKTCQVNLTGSFLIIKYALKAMLPNKYGRILLMASIAGKEGNAGMLAYSASKAGVIGLVKAAGKEYAESGVTINAIAPATIMTPMVERMEPLQIKYMTDKIPMKRCGQLQEIANLAAWIVSGEASFNTGFTFDMTGGRAVY
ncbi:SDR family NAD(P)-dependent oxidoreductase [Agriterribacter sp.]|uniref:SDR family NAD(P)-dependent oxidoreductase n=1 Tax=Agriterribacter sp. TaxID=2821509 RepID=UPI002C14A773|nr:SDR family NAD(P)-dependent oxidoreductase [Agriterribacter sp.]HRP57023.1 SDR family NAD(P)-dependent oxidoreductase [Agriterribacter sp.]